MVRFYIGALVKKRKILLQLSALLVLITFLGHTMGSDSLISTDSIEALSVSDIIKSTFAMVPTGEPKNYAEFLIGENLPINIFLLVSSFLFLFLSSSNFNKMEFDLTDSLVVDSAVVKFVFSAVQ